MRLGLGLFGPLWGPACMNDPFEKAANRRHLPDLGATPEQVQASAARWRFWWLKPAAVALSAFVLMYLWRFSPFDAGYTDHLAHTLWCFLSAVLVCLVLAFYLQLIRSYVSYVRDLHLTCTDYEQVHALLSQAVNSGNQQLVNLTMFIAGQRSSLYWYEVEWFQRMLSQQVLPTLKEKQ